MPGSVMGNRFPTGEVAKLNFRKIAEDLTQKGGTYFLLGPFQDRET